MSLKIRLQRAGAKKAPFYKIVVIDSRTRRDGRFKENIGTFNPKQFPEGINLNFERLNYWIDKGALPSETVKKLSKTVKKNMQKS